MTWKECGRCGKVYPEDRRNPFFFRCGACRASLYHYDWTVWDVVVVVSFVVAIFVIAGGISWILI